MLTMVPQEKGGGGCGTVYLLTVLFRWAEYARCGTVDLLTVLFRYSGRIQPWHGTALMESGPFDSAPVHLAHLVIPSAGFRVRGFPC